MKTRRDPTLYIWPDGSLRREEPPHDGPRYEVTYERGDFTIEVPEAPADVVLAEPVTSWTGREP